MFLYLLQHLLPASSSCGRFLHQSNLSQIDDKPSRFVLWVPRSWPNRQWYRSCQCQMLLRFEEFREVRLGYPSIGNVQVLLSAAIKRSPWRTWISTAGWLSAAVEKTCDLEVGIVVLRSMSFVNTPPIVWYSSDNGVTSRRTTSLTSLVMTPPW